MKVRILTAVGIAIFGIPLLIFSQYLFYPIAISLLSVIAIFEMSGLTGFRKTPVVVVPAYLIAAALPVVGYYAADIGRYLLYSAFVVFVYMLYLFGYLVIKRGEISFDSISSHFMSFAYITVSFTSLCLVRYIALGGYYFLLVFVASWICDSFAYFVGRAIGKHKLIPEISPKKTVEGAIGGVVCTTMSFALFGLIVDLISELTPNYLLLCLFGFVLSIVAQFGDLIASLIKREHGVKDYGNIFPGHGGVLDRFDSILAVAPILLALCVIFPPLA